LDGTETWDTDSAFASNTHLQFQQAKVENICLVMLQVTVANLGDADYSEITFNSKWYKR
jgi:hypothetical protein